MCKILVVDDEPKVLRALKEAMYEYDVSISTSAHEARELWLNSEKFDVIIADQMMPFEKGHELLTWCHEHQPDCERFLLTGLPVTAGLKDILKPAGEVKIFSKPWNFESLVVELDRIKQQARAKEESLLVNEMLKTKASATKFEVKNRLLVFETSDIFTEQYTKNLRHHYDEIVKLDRDTLNDSYAKSNTTDNIEIIFEIGNEITDDVDLITPLANYYRAKHVLIVARPGDALALKAFNMDPARFKVITIPFSPKRLLHNLKLFNPMQ